jgi:hypothetical protein
MSSKFPIERCEHDAMLKCGASAEADDFPKLSSNMFYNFGGTLSVATFSAFSPQSRFACRQLNRITPADHCDHGADSATRRTPYVLQPS